MQVELACGDITAMAVDAVVNAANNALLGGGGVDGAIHRAGGAAILEECRELRRTALPHGLPTGSAIATSGGRLTARWVIHTVGPVFSADEDRSAQLRSCYTESLFVADELGARTVAFPLISAGVFGWPKDDAIRQALRALGGADRSARGAGAGSVREVTLVLFDQVTFDQASRINAAAE